MRYLSIITGSIILLIGLSILFISQKEQISSSLRGSIVSKDVRIERIRSMVDINPADFTLTKQEMKNAMVTAIIKVIIGTDLTYDFSGNGILNKEDLRFFLEVIQYLLSCGNGGTSNIEECDDGNTFSGDGCSAICTQEDGFICSYEPDSPSICENNPLPYCGNGKTNVTEECDDGNTHNGDGCSAQCNIEQGYTCEITALEMSACYVCGNGKIEMYEECDDGNTVSGDGCTGTDPNLRQAACKLDFCGNGRLEVEKREQCDDGSRNALSCVATSDQEFCSFCRSVWCTVVRQPNPCGNGILDPGEECDEGRESSSRCSNTCKSLILM